MTSASIDSLFSSVDLRPNAPSILVLLPCRYTFLLHALHRPAFFSLFVGGMILYLCMVLSCLILSFCPWLFAPRMCLFFHILQTRNSLFPMEWTVLLHLLIICFLFFPRYSSIHGHKIEASPSQIITKSRLQMSPRRSFDGPEHHQRTESLICPGQASTLELPLPPAPSNVSQ